MAKTFYRSELEDGSITCSWYDKNGRRYKTENSSFSGNYDSVRECDDMHGFMAYACMHNFNVFDDVPVPHPRSLKSD